MLLIDRIGIERGRMSPVVAAPHHARWRDGTGGGKMSDRHVIGNPGEEPEAAPPRTRRRLPLRIAEVREVQAPPALTPLSGVGFLRKAREKCLSTGTISHKCLISLRWYLGCHDVSATTPSQ